MAVVTFLLLRIAITAVAFGLTSWLLSGMEMSGGVFAYLWVSILFGLVNALIGTFVRLITLPFIILTLGLFAVLINALMLQITDALTSHLTIDEFWWTAVWAAIVLGIVTMILDLVIRSLLARRMDDARPVPNA
jgi:putative membrane protein